MIPVALLVSLLLTSISVAAQPDTSSLNQTNPQPDPIRLGINLAYAGFDAPLQVTNAGDGSDRLFVVERAGRIRVIEDGDVQEEPFLDVTALVTSDSGEQGFFSVAFHPDYETNGYFYVSFTAQPDGANTIARFQVSEADPNLADPASMKTLFAIPDENDTHNGGGLAFGPDGYLYVGTGDGGGQSDPNKNAQNRGRLLGKILRVDVDVPSGSSAPYAIPPDNPFVDDDSARPEVWAYGMRNPFRLSFDSETGDLYIGDVGDGKWEEVDFQPAGSQGGQNYGWPLTEGKDCFPPGRDCDMAGITLPIIVYSHDDGCSITGGTVYRGDLAPSARGRYLFADWCSGLIWSAQQDSDGEWRDSRMIESGLMVTSFGADEAGVLYVTDMAGGGLHRLSFLRESSDLSLSSLDPHGANAGESGFTLTVRGAGFTEDAVVLWDGKQRETTYVSDSELQAAILPSDLNFNLSAAPTLVIDVSVAIPGSDASVSNVLPFTITAFADEAFQQVWERTDAPVAELEVSRTWMWGPKPVTGPMAEPYAESTGGERLVQYFDKSRMELNNFQGDVDPTWRVTNGLLVVELISGQLQLGNDTFEQREAATISIAGDADDQTGPTYETFSQLLDRVSDQTGQIVADVISRDGSVDYNAGRVRQGVRNTFYDEVTGHNIAAPFWTFMNSRGMVLTGGELEDAPLFRNPFYATGRPITEPYWATVKIANANAQVLIQCFERRCLTYGPEKSPGWQVETGNVGRHYYEWRYGPIQ